MRWAGLGEDHKKWEGPPLLLYKQVFSASGNILKTLVVVVVQSLSRVQLFVTPWTAARLSFTVSQSLLKVLSIVLMLPSNHLILCHPFSSCPQSFPVSGSFPMIIFSHQVAKVFELQLQRQSFQ